ncbi:hypothetical protein [uncultured Pontibacter sp.]|uniref:outer membrane beta-barrel protein n=1 Tax=uncultured Pontibacter sp. TaxID=453356 RepID=UPI002601A699|nr:hypothetical protein [uncultured Pontibacter sp.]
MKTTNLLLLLMLVASSAFAQFQTGNKLVGLHAGAGFSKPDEFSRVTSLEASSSMGYFLKDKLVVGLSYGYKYAANREERTSAPSSSSMFYFYDNKTITHAYNIGPMARYYISLGNKFALFAEGTAGLAFISERSELHYSGTGQFGDPMTPSSGSQSSSTSRLREASLYGTLSPGLVFFPNERIGIELKLNAVDYLYGLDRGSQLKNSFSLSKTNLGIGFYF